MSLREADLKVGDRLRYFEGGTDAYVGYIDNIERSEGRPAMVLFTLDNGTHFILRLSKLARTSQRLPAPLPV